MGAGLGRKGGVVRWSTADPDGRRLGPDAAGRRSGRRRRRVAHRPGQLGRRRRRACCLVAGAGASGALPAQAGRPHQRQRRAATPSRRASSPPPSPPSPRRPPGRGRHRRDRSGHRPEDHHPGPGTRTAADPAARPRCKEATRMNIDWAALGSVFGVSLVVTVGLVGLFTLGIVGLSKQRAGRAAQGGSAALARHRRVRLLRAVRGGRGVRDLSDRRLSDPTGSPSTGVQAVTGPGTPRVHPARCGSSHTLAAAGQGRVDGHSRTVVDCRSHIRRQERKPVRIRRGPATVTGERTPNPTSRPVRTRAGRPGDAADPGARRLSPPVTSNQGADP